MSNIKLLRIGNELRAGLAKSISRRYLSSDIINPNDFPPHKSLVVEEFGDPSGVKLKLRKPDEILPKRLESNDIIIEHLAAPVNPADINIVQGVYGRRPQLPAILGNEGIARVKKIGANVHNVKVNDLVIDVMMMSNWQSYSVQPAKDFFPIKLDDIRTAAQLKVNPSTAYRMIKDFIKLEPGDTIIQNGANSAVGYYVIQLAKLWGLNTINVIRDRPDREALVEELKTIGATHVVTEEEVGSHDAMKGILSNLKRPKLFLNCVGGKNAISCQKTLDKGGFSVTYGAMSRQPFSISAASLIFKDHKYVGFWVSQWFQNKLDHHKKDDIKAMLDELSHLFTCGSLKPKASTLISFEDRNEAFSGPSNTKYIFNINL